MRSFTMLAHADRKRFEPLQEHPRIEWTHARPTGTHHRDQLFFDKLTRGNDRAAKTTPLPVQILGRRMDDDIGTELQWLLQDWCTEAIIDDQQRARGVGETR